MITHLEMDLLARPRRVQANEPLGLGVGDPLVRGGDLAMELERFLLHPVGALARALVPPEASLDRALEQEGDVRTGEGRRPARRYTPGAALVGERRVVVAVGDHDLARRQRGRDDL